MLPTDPESVSSRFSASVLLFGSRPATLSMPCTGTSPAPPKTVGMMFCGDHENECANRNSPPTFIACAPFVQLNVSVYPVNGLRFPRLEHVRSPGQTIM